MARGGRASFTVDSKQLERGLRVALRRVDRGTKKATIAAVQEIQEESLRQVPRKSETLASSFYSRIYKVGRSFEADFGYGGNGNPLNPETQRPVSDYMVAVHEDLRAKHKIGKAKFLEDPVRVYQAKRLLPGAAAIIKRELN